MGRRVCRFLIGVYLLLYLAALSAAVVGAKGLFGVSPDGLSAVYLVFLGIPWTLALAFLPVPEVLAQIAFGAAPLLNAAIAFALCRRKRRRYYE